MPKAPNRRKPQITSRMSWKDQKQKAFAVDYATKVSGDLSSYVQEHFEEVREKQEKLKA